MTAIGVACVLISVSAGVSANVSHNTETCNSVLRIDCKETPESDLSLIIMLNTNASAWLTLSMLEKCNGRQGPCLVPNPDKECVWYQHKCESKHDIFVLKQSETLHTTSQREFYLASDGYFEGRYQEAQTVVCDISWAYRYGSPTFMTVNFLEFSPLASSIGYCFYKDDTGTVLFCSGSGNLAVSRKLSNSHKSNPWKQRIVMEMMSELCEAPLVRIFLKFTFPPAFPPGSCSFDVNCTSSDDFAGRPRIPNIVPECSGTSPESDHRSVAQVPDASEIRSNSKFTICSIVLSCIVVILAICTGVAMFAAYKYRRRLFQVIPASPLEPVYHEIDSHKIPSSQAPVLETRVLDIHHADQFLTDLKWTKNDVYGMEVITICEVNNL